MEWPWWSSWLCLGYSEHSRWSVTHTHTHTHTHMHSLSLTHTLSLLSLIHTHTLSLSLSHTHTLSLSLSLQVARFGRLRIIVLTILKAIKVRNMQPQTPSLSPSLSPLSLPSQSMVFITILLFAVAYIFAIVGVVFFESYSIPDRPDLSYHHSFRWVNPSIT